MGFVEPDGTPDLYQAVFFRLGEQMLASQKLVHAMASFRTPTSPV